MGQPLRGSVSPIGVGVAAGAFIFGLGMQLGGGCASGTLFSVGGGSTRMLITLFFFIIGSVIGTAHMGWWTAQPAFPATSIVTTMGPWAALAASLALFGAIAWITMVAERKRHGQLVDEPKPAIGSAMADRTVAARRRRGRPRDRQHRDADDRRTAVGRHVGVRAVGREVVCRARHRRRVVVRTGRAPAQATALKSSVLMDVTSVMDFGIILGALLAAILAGRFAPVWKISGRSLAAAVIGGLLLGYGARIAYGCNIGAYFSGIASGSLHGWLWLVAAFVGNIAGTRLRPMFDLNVEKTRTAC